MAEIGPKRSIGIKTKFLRNKPIDYTAENDRLGQNRGYVYVKYTSYKWIADVETGELYEEATYDNNWGSPWGVSAQEGADLFEDYITDLISRPQGHRYAISKIQVQKMEFVNAAQWGEEPDEIPEIDIDEIGRPTWEDYIGMGWTEQEILLWGSKGIWPYRK